MFYKKFLQCPAHSSPSKNRTELQQHRFCTSEFDRLLALCQGSKIVVFTEKKRKYACFQEKFEKSANHIFFLRVGRKTMFELESFQLPKNCNFCCDLRCTACFNRTAPSGYSGPVVVIEPVRRTEPVCNRNSRHSFEAQGVRACTKRGCLRSDPRLFCGSAQESPY